MRRALNCSVGQVVTAAVPVTFFVVRRIAVIITAVMPRIVRMVTPVSVVAPAVVVVMGIVIMCVIIWIIPIITAVAPAPGLARIRSVPVIIVTQIDVYIIIRFVIIRAAAEAGIIPIIKMIMVFVDFSVSVIDSNSVSQVSNWFNRARIRPILNLNDIVCSKLSVAPL